MIQFFRRIRKSLLTESKFSKYLLYAVGEILLVVIGILIALQINNWNEQNKIDENNRVKLNSVQEELLINLEIAESAIIQSNQKLAGINQVLYDTLTTDDYLMRGSGWSLRFLLLSVTLFNPVQESYNTLIESQDNLPDSYNGIINNLNQLYVKTQKYIDLSNDSQKAILDREIQHLSNTYDWYHEVNTSSRNLSLPHVEYLLTDPFYKNRVSEMQTMTRALNQMAKVFKHYAIETYLDISEFENQIVEKPLIIEAYYTPTDEEVNQMEFAYESESLTGYYLTIFLKENKPYIKSESFGELEMFFTDSHSFYVFTSPEFLREYKFDEDFSSMHQMSGMRNIFTYNRVDNN